MFRWTRVLSKSSRLFFLLWTEPCLNVSGICRSVQESSCACCRLKINKYQIKIYNLGNVSYEKKIIQLRRGVCGWVQQLHLLAEMRWWHREERPGASLIWGVVVGFLASHFSKLFVRETIKGQVTCCGAGLTYIIKEMDAKYSCNHEILLNLDFKMSELNTAIFFLHVHELNFWDDKKDSCIVGWKIYR